MPEAAPVIITGRPPSGLTAFAPSGLTAFAPSGLTALPPNGLTARLPIAPRFVAIGPPLPVLVDPVPVDPVLIDLRYAYVPDRRYARVPSSARGGRSVTTVSTARHEAGLAGTAPAEFRRRLLEGMAAAIRETGYREATVADVVRHARTSRRTFYEHFPSKQACFIDLLREANAAMIRQIGAAVDRRAPWDAQVRQAIEAWIAVAQADLALTLSWIRDLPSLGADARHLQREWLEAFIVLVRELTDTPELRAAGVAPPSRQLMIMMLGGLRELVATTVEDGGDIGGITEVAVRATQAMLGPNRRPGPA
jgi:AcrR family transcriptional regulator